MYDFMKKQHRDLLAEAAMDLRSYSADPYSRHRLENQRHEGTPIASARVPQMVTMEQDADGKWWGNKPAYGPFDTVRDLEIAVYGRSNLSAAPGIGETMLGRPMNDRPRGLLWHTVALAP
jgi:hypothetical protein